MRKITLTELRKLVREEVGDLTKRAGKMKFEPTTLGYFKRYT